MTTPLKQLLARYVIGLNPFSQMGDYVHPQQNDAHGDFYKISGDMRNIGNDLRIVSNKTLIYYGS